MYNSGFKKNLRIKNIAIFVPEVAKGVAIVGAGVLGVGAAVAVAPAVLAYLANHTHFQYTQSARNIQILQRCQNIVKGHFVIHKHMFQY